MGTGDVKSGSTSKKSSPQSNPISPKTSDLQLRKNTSTEDLQDDSNAQDTENDSDSKPQVPMQKRRRVTRACDECRRKKIKCDGKQPCTHCTVYSYDCTYDQPSNRRRNPAPQYIEALEQRLQKAEALLRSVLPSIDLDDPKYDARGVEQILEANRAAFIKAPGQQYGPEDDAQMRSMIDRTGSLDLDDTGYYDYHGNSSGYTFMRKFRATFGDDLFANSRSIENRSIVNIQGSSKSLQSSPFEGTSFSNALPPKDVATELCRNTIDDCCALQRPLHRPTFFKRLDSIYALDPENYTNEHIKFVPLLYSSMAVGCLFGRFDDKKSELDKKGYRSAIEQGYQYFQIAKTMLDITDCRDMMSIQAVMFMILFLQGTAKLATCYAYIGVALRACCRLGMHRKITGKFNTIEQEERKRLFWQVRGLDIYVGAMLGLPMMLSDDDIDQGQPSEVPDEHITENGILPVSQEIFPLYKATNAHTKLLHILQKVVRYVYPVKNLSEATSSGEYTVSHSLIRELERDLQSWMDELPMQLRPSENADIELSRVQQLLRMSYAYVQMMIYRPFLHYVAQASQTARTDKRSFACAAACVSVARNIVHITSEMKRRGLLMGSYWFVMYTTYFAILSLLYFVLENPESTTSKEILKDAVEGRETLASLATRSMAADRCSSSLAGLFEALPDKLKERRGSLRIMPNTAKKRPPPVNEPPFFGNQSAVSTPDANMPTQLRNKMVPQEYLKTATKKMSLLDASVTGAAPYTFTPDAAYANPATPTETIGYSSSQAATPASLESGTPALLHGQLPDLKSLMFPGNNPFAYPNQPMSTLDTMPNLPFGNEPSSAADQYNTPTSMTSQQQFQQRSDDRTLFPYEFRHQENQVPQQFFGINPILDEPRQIQHAPQQTHLQVPNHGEEEDYWSHAPAKGHFRTGLTPGGPGINLNLDEIFGNSQGWNMSNMPMNLAMPEHDQQQQSMPWSGQGGHSWQ